ncbi:DNA integrity scanning diadenylate cyclase DisA [Acetivibrio saccincola]|jgi:diadenylate cyclase|uniref:DNA integrity scanning protein DisA n=1 Tax=Acetivibrio saccincola TaxID=1677857 RepID=A0A2K9E3Y3_9FIRM|nr:DNA integrity scanning diadenylate cyclase DisA [Acetivibrio saccincola]AUG58432.1 DNA integrity scanning protein DisA [Acetivibrio saccincola]NLW25885.1 DNA integrity scanning protein DisA [Acetivibrio saccincola]PQQ66365.1 DNA integrity scanning protein DisA [Acetivibrio saccincola]HOA97254.1 DNA integrity scanning diadenylate cyclase DisA [Acetivibrio saccincola]HQD28322.1 DNA integrity scanning diadenylate cyclase DisA [Acetivibrio saccincola]
MVDNVKDEKFLELLKMIAPGTALREGLENILKARTGALIVIGDSPEIMSLIDGGFFINKEYSPAHLYELAKMDGAIVLSRDLKKLLYANTLLIPDPKISTDETGTRHKAAHRVAKQTGETVISISQRRNVITIYKGSIKYILKDVSVILNKANQAMQTLEKYKTVLETAVNNLSALEFENIVTLNDVAFVIQRTEMVLRVASEIERYICELGNEGRLISMQLEELLDNIENDEILIIEDYMEGENMSSKEIQKNLRSLSFDELMEIEKICKLLGYNGDYEALETTISPRGYRLLSKIPKVPVTVTRNLVDRFLNFQGILNASIEELDDVEGIGEIRARLIKEGLRRIQGQLFLNVKKI